MSSKFARPNPAISPAVTRSMRVNLRRTRRSLVLLIAAGACHAAANRPAPATRDGRALVLSGGEYIHPALRRRFVELAGGPEREFVYVPTASSGIRLATGFEYEPSGADTANPTDRDFERELAQLFAVRRIRLLHTRSRSTANADTFVAALRRADGVWLSGGNAGRLADAYLGTRVETELRALLRRGGVIGGNSAGAIIQGSFVVRGRPDKPVLMAPGRTHGFAFLERVAINPHLLSQKRENELVTVLDAHPELLGVGISDSAGVVVRGDTLEVAGDGRVALYDNRRHGCCWYYWLRPGQRFHLGQRQAVP